MTDGTSALEVLQRCIDRGDLDARGWEAVSSFGPANGRRGAYRVDLHDGRTVKARVLLDARAAERVVRLQTELRSGRLADALPRPLLHAGRLLVDEWVEGRGCGPDENAPELIDDAAALLADLHGHGAPHPDASPAPVRDEAQARVRELAAVRVIDASQAESLSRLLTQTCPGTATTGVVHGDFCAANLVRDHDRRLWVVDNEELDVGFVDHDLALTWYRWSLEEADVARFERAYSRRAARTPQAEAFFRVAAAVKGLFVRWKLQPDTIDVAARRVSELIGP